MDKRLMGTICEIEGELTKKQEQKLETIMKILNSFECFNEETQDFYAEWLTLNEIKERTDLSKGIISRYMRELFKKGVVEGKVEIKNKKFVMVFTLTGKNYEMKGKVKDEDKIYFPKNRNEKYIIYERGVLRKRKRKKLGKTRRVIGRYKINLEKSPKSQQ